MSDSERHAHTPGPWMVAEMGGDWYVFANDGQAMVADGSIDEPWIARMRGIGRGATVEEQKANAELIARAPMLDAALRAAEERAQKAEALSAAASAWAKCARDQDGSKEARDRQAKAHAELLTAAFALRGTGGTHE